MKPFAAFCVVLFALAGAGCKSEPERTPAIGEAFVGPSTLSVRQDIPLQSRVVATINHGERLEILQRRRRFVKIRTSRNVEGWTDDRLLLSPEEVANLRKLAERSKSAPSQGAATTYEMLNVHTEPDRQSPSFLQVKEGEKVDVIGRRVTPRNSPPAAPKPLPVAPPKPRTKKQLAREKEKGNQIPPPPMPAAPKLPPNWTELSKFGTPGAIAAPKAEPQPIPMDDWSQIRNAAGVSGWVLTRRLVMAIPDEVAQYAEGRRITSYSKLGDTPDGKLVKPSWLWTTVDHGLQPYDFDSFRVFVWSLRRHRYETAHIERNLTGYYPILTHPVAPPKPRGAKDAGESGAKVPGFSILIERSDGRRYRRNYAFLGNLVRFSSEEAIAVEPEQKKAVDPGLLASARAQDLEQARESMYGRIKQKMEDWRKRLLGR